MNFLLVFIMSTLAFAISTISAGGAGLMLIPLLSLLLDPILVPVALTLGTAASSLARLVAFYEYVDWKLVHPMAGTAIPGVFIGGYLLSLLDPVYVEFAMSLFLISNIALLFQQEKTSSSPTPLAPRMRLGMGFLVGFISTLTGAVGVLFNRLYFQHGLDTQEIIATRAANEVIVHVLKLALYAYLGLLNDATIGIGSAIALAAVLTVIAVKKHLHRLPREFCIKVAYLVMAGSGVIMLQYTAMDIIDQHNPRIKTTAYDAGGDLVLGWNDSFYTLEFTLDDGLVFEKNVPLASLPDHQRNEAISQCTENERLYVEAVYTTRLTQYEIHCFDQATNQLTRKVVFLNT